MDFLPLPDSAARQLIDSITVFGEYRRARTHARAYVGGMYWKRQGDYEYLVKTHADGRQHRIGPRSAETETTHAQFTERKLKAEDRLKTLGAALKDSERLNKALKV